MFNHHLAALLAMSLAALPAGCKKEDKSAVPAAAAEAAPATGRRLEITVTSDGFVAPANKVKVGEPVTLVVTRKIDRTCAKDIVIKDYGISKPLPQDQPVEVTFTPQKAGPIRYACAMDMVAGELVAE